MTRKYLSILVASVLGLVASGCVAPIIEEKYAQEVVGKALSLSGPLTAQRLTGGLSGADLFRVSGGAGDYVVRFALHVAHEDAECTVHNSQIASKDGCGPQVYFADPSQGLMIIEYLPNRVLSPEEMRSDRVAGQLADLLHKIHRGIPFDRSDDIFKSVIRKLLHMKSDQWYRDVPVARLVELVQAIQKTALGRLSAVPSHNDLTQGNLRFGDGVVKAIDYVEAAQSNPYVDVAMLVLFYPIDEGLLLEQYCERKPSLQEQAQLYLMKLVVLINDAQAFLGGTGTDLLGQYACVQVPLFEECIRAYHAGEIDLGKAENRLKFAKSTINQVLANAETQEFRDAIKLLS